jgi:hypothetical protein
MLMLSMKSLSERLIYCETLAIQTEKKLTNRQRSWR